MFRIATCVWNGYSSFYVYWTNVLNFQRVLNLLLLVISSVLGATVSHRDTKKERKERWYFTAVFIRIGVSHFNKSYLDFSNILINFKCCAYFTCFNIVLYYENYKIGDIFLNSLYRRHISEQFIWICNWCIMLNLLFLNSILFFMNRVHIPLSVNCHNNVLTRLALGVWNWTCCFCMN